MTGSTSTTPDLSVSFAGIDLRIPSSPRAELLAMELNSRMSFT